MALVLFCGRVFLVLVLPVFEMKRAIVFRTARFFGDTFGGFELWQKADLVFVANIDSVSAFVVVRTGSRHRLPGVSTYKSVCNFGASDKVSNS